MNFNNVKLIISAGRADQCPKKRLPEIVVSGKSNVGKSSLINRLLGRRNFARVSATPGKTATINFYEIDEKLTLCDLPGYGFARVSKEERQKWADLVEGYLGEGERIDLLIQLLDIRHSPTDDDKGMISWLCHYEVPFMLVCTKADKLSPLKAAQRIEEIRAELDLPEDTFITAFSSLKGTGCDTLRGELLRLSSRGGDKNTV